MVVVAARPARAALLMDDGRAHRPLAVALPEALRPPRARDAGRVRRRGGLGRGVPALAPGALAPRHGAATEADLSRYLTFPRFGPGARRATLRSMHERGEVP